MVMVNGRVRYPRKAGCSMELTCEFACCAWLLATWEKRRSLSLECEFGNSLGTYSGLRTPDTRDLFAERERWLVGTILGS